MAVHETTSSALFVQNSNVGFSNYAICHAIDVYSGDYKTSGSSMDGIKGKDGFGFLQLMEERGVEADSNTYIWLLKGCLNSGSVKDAKMLHGKILKSGLFRDCSLCYQIIEVYLGIGELDGAVKIFDNMSERSIYSWNSILSAFLKKKLYRRVLGYFLRVLAEGISPDGATFSNVLRACSGGNFGLHYVRQIHSKILQYGFATDPVVCNPLIDIYSKKGYLSLAQSIFEELSSRNSISWVAMISGLSQNGHEEEALQLFCQMRKSGIIPTPYVFSSVLSASTKIGMYKQGEQLHAQVHKWGFSLETFVCNSLVTLYSHSGKLISAERIFKGMKRRDRITYNSLISALAQRGVSNEALLLFEEMQLSGLKPDCVTVASLLSACASMEALHKGRQFHCHAIKSGFSSDVIIEGSLLDLYVKCSDIATARDFFESTEKENVVLWNVMLVAYGQLGNLIDSFQVFSQMQIAGVKPNQYTYPSILRTCTSLGALDLGAQIHAQIIKTGFDLNVYVCSVLIDMYAKHGRLELAREILGRLTAEDVVSWTAMISGYVQHEMCLEGLKLFQEMQIRGIQSDNIGYSSALSACAGIQALNQGKQIHAQACVSGYAVDLSIGNALIHLYAKCGRVHEAYLAFKLVDAKDQISWNGLISGFAQSGLYEEALKVFTQMNQAGLEANLFTFGSVVSASANLADIKQGKQMHARMIKTGFNSEIEASNVLISLYAKCGSIDDAKREFNEMREKNEVSWNAMITGYSQHGCGNEALDLFEKMKEQDMMPNNVTFLGVLSACSHVGLVNKGLSYLQSMSIEHGIAPRPEHYACVVDILGRAGLLERAKKFIEEMPIDPDAMVWRTLLSACTVHKNVEIGELAAQHLLLLEPQDSATYVLLSNIYAVAKKWDSRDKMRQMMKDNGVKKEPGRSWIEVKNSVHAFFVGDRLHPLAEKIYDFLKDLNERVSEMGYVQDQNSLLHDIEQEQKDPTVHIHSEKLAVAFGLISLSSSIPIRVIKNLRVCSDCHNWMKYVSKVSGRPLVVRDPYRFHHFHDGVCSCKDYW
ncbi:hypothetical protein AQUCO_05000042v1 [Aquilegia coerulea]|uniref:DYW domain-containing protein n=1 Tax=Aquilegia coerulea TaxID=218851 RepID=A0A2G5CJB4_AQUCA|nr:hypothetical protein AQUCO_05000042v1 [Aquilegia coerulea]